jgi:hypothetical protein
MPVIRIRRDEMNLVEAAADRKARRTNSRFVIKQERVEVAEESSASAEPDRKDQNLITDAHAATG